MDFHDRLGRIGGVAVIDVVGTAIGAEIFLKKWMPPGSSRPIVYLFAFSLGYVTHGLLNIKTKINV